MRRILFATLALALTACNQAEAPPAPDETFAEDGCPAHVTTTWTAAGQEFAVSANTTGSTCAEATANLEVRAPNGDLALAFSAQTQHVMGLSGVTETEAMQAALAGWVEAASERARTTGNLPAWPEGAAQPGGGEFPFYPQEGAERASYESLRAENLPLFCVIQGMESEACHVLRGTELHLIGVQTFPG